MKTTYTHMAKKKEKKKLKLCSQVGQSKISIYHMKIVTVSYLNVSCLWDLNTDELSTI